MFVPNRSLRTLRRLKLMNACIYLLIGLAQVGQLTWGPIQPVRSGLALSVWLLLGSLALYTIYALIDLIFPTPADWQRDREIIGRFVVVFGAMAVIMVGLTA